MPSIRCNSQQTDRSDLKSRGGGSSYAFGDCLCQKANELHENLPSLTAISPATEGVRETLGLLSGMRDPEPIGALNEMETDIWGTTYCGGLQGYNGV